MIQSTKHAPLPWKVNRRNSVIWGGFIQAIDGRNVALYYAHPEMDTGIAEGKANARFIVKACNSYSSLIDTLRTIAEGCEADVDGEGEPFDLEGQKAWLDTCASLARKAIANAEGR